MGYYIARIGEFPRRFAAFELHHVAPPGRQPGHGYCNVSLMRWNLSSARIFEY